MNFEIFARKNGGQFAPVWGGQFDRSLHIGSKGKVNYGMMSNLFSPVAHGYNAEIQ